MNHLHEAWKAREAARAAVLTHSKRILMFTDCTGLHGLAGCRRDYADAEAFGHGYVYRDTWSGCLDAPSYMPQGSVRVHNTLKHSPSLSLANRDVLAGHAAPGVGMDDGDPPIIRAGFAR